MHMYLKMYGSNSEKNQNYRRNALGAISVVSRGFSETWHRPQGLCQKLKVAFGVAGKTVPRGGQRRETKCKSAVVETHLAASVSSQKAEVPARECA